MRLDWRRVLFSSFLCQIGLANKQALVESRVQCASRVICEGMEVHYDPLNICLPPPCAEYYFFEHDASSKQCKLVSRRKSIGSAESLGQLHSCTDVPPPVVWCFQSAGFHILCGIVIGVFILAELGLNEVVIFLSAKVQQNGIAAGQ